MPGMMIKVKSKGLVVMTEHLGPNSYAVLARKDTGKTLSGEVIDRVSGFNQFSDAARYAESLAKDLATEEDPTNGTFTSSQTTVI